MQVPLQIHFDDMDRSEAIEQAIREKLEKLERFAPDIVSCRVTVAAPHKHHRHGRLYHVAVDVRVPGGEVMANRDPGAHHSHEDVYVALRDAFNAAQRQLQDIVRIQRGKVKAHQPSPEGTIAELHAEQDFGRISTADGRLVYFHRNSVIDADFDQLKVGMPVRFHEEEGAQGPQASTMHVIEKARSL
jgi:ribosomal subunit interface protein